MYIKIFQNKIELSYKTTPKFVAYKEFLFTNEDYL
jgi:hypothetical protein